MRVSWTAQVEATVVGTVVGTGGWFFGIGHHVWAAHPGWAVALMTIAATIITMFIASREEARAPKK